MSDDVAIPPSAESAYAALLTDLRALISGGRSAAAAAINAEIVATYWRIGERIVREEQAGQARAEYGEQVLARLGATLSREFGRGFVERNLYYMRQFYLAYPILNAVRSELTWTHYRTLMRLPDDQREFYARMAVVGRWSSRELERQLASMLYERAGHSRRPEGLATDLPQPGRVPTTLDEAFRDPYVLDFFVLESAFLEKDLETALPRMTGAP